MSNDWSKLSNTRTPKYYNQFRNDVMSGKIPVNQYIEMQMNIVDARIKNPNIYYDEYAVDGWIKFCEGECTLTDGSPLNLLDSFKLWGEDLYGWWYFTEQDVYVPTSNGILGHYEKKIIKKRLINKQYLIVGRGAAKSLYESCVQNYELNVNTSTTTGITVAPTMIMADEVMALIRTSILVSRGPLFKFLTDGSINNTTGPIKNRVKLLSTKKGIENFLTGSIISVRPMSLDKLQGLKQNVATIDEWLSCDVREDVVSAMEQSGSKNDDFIIVAVSSEGTVRNGSGDNIKLELINILKGKYQAPHTSIWYYRLDDVKEVAYPEMWLKANPNLGKTVRYEAYQNDVERANNVPEVRNDILAKRFGIPLEGYTYFFPYEDTKVHSHKDFVGMSCALGGDMSQGNDFCAFTFLFPLPNEMYGVKARSYISSNTYDLLHPAMKTKYDQFIAEGSLVVLEGITINMDQVYSDLEEYIDKNDYTILSFGYDPYNAMEFVNKYCAHHSAFGVEKVIQGARTESVPLGELYALAHSRKLLFDQYIMQYTMGNAITIEDSNGNRKLMKKSYEAKIDNVSALMDAWVSYKHNRDSYL